MTPLPAASPSAFTTMGAAWSLMYTFACSGLLKTSYLAVGMLYFLQRSCEEQGPREQGITQAYGPIAKEHSTAGPGSNNSLLGGANI